ncbi:hypothetical protein A5893_12595 [Pedobacter psychrophilus]|uniref:Secretion system C-terminal sorting domain-containing protein n=1 Tax=Pedobacter psychrophilus TaxID=1826909 RepID=A0A179DDA3_9SPHI|nr:T9SS type A sorting domain-containing protein [Pedobacter psychrophilus]OAQ38874.1 hypothetical protein A5893_12595 [Pedobacter psychrophilus]
MKKLLPFLIVFQLFITFVNAQTCTTPTGGTITGFNNGCVDRVGTYNISGVTNATGYNWSVNNVNLATINKITDTQYSVVFNGPGNIVISVTPTNGSCTGTTITYSVNVSSTPNKPTIAQTGQTLAASTSNSYQWYLGSTLLANQTSQTISPTQTGQYRVQVTGPAPASCSIFSDPFNYVLTAIKEDNKFDGLTFYPNPVTSTIHVDFAQKFDVEFFDISGRKSLQKSNLKGSEEIDLSELNRGIYIMRVNSGGKFATRKLILQ